MDKSDVFTCRPPKQLEARIYLVFQKEPEIRIIHKLLMQC
jgi:hypothetical protein